MIIKQVTVRCESGLHNKQATYFVQKANEFECSIWVECGTRKMNAKSLLGIMSLGIVTGAVVKNIPQRSVDHTVRSGSWQFCCVFAGKSAAGRY